MILAQNKLHLTGWTVIVTRPVAQAQMLCEQISRAGGQALAIPAIRIVPPDDSTAFSSALSRQGDYDLSLFVSQNAANAVLSELMKQKRELSGEICAVGQSTAACLKTAGLQNIIVPENGNFTSEGVLSALEKRELRGKKIAIFRAQSGRDWLTQQLQARGAHVTPIQSYQRQSVTAPPTAAITHAIDNAPKLATLCASTQTAKALLALLSKDSLKRVRAAPLIVPSLRVSHSLLDEADQLIIADSAMDADMLLAIPTIDVGQ